MKNLKFKMQLLLFCGVFVAMLSSCSDNSLTNEDDMNLLSTNAAELTFDNTLINENNIYALGDDEVRYPCNESLIDDVQANIIWSDDCIPTLVMTLCCDCPYKGKDFESGCTTGVNSTFDIRYSLFQAPGQFYTINIPNTSLANGDCIDLSVEITGYVDTHYSHLSLVVGYNGGYNFTGAYSDGCE